MKDKRINKIEQHYDVFFNDHKFKIIAFKIDESNGIIFIKTKIFGQPFPRKGRFLISIPSKKTTQDISIEFRSMCKDTAIENWEYTFKPE